MVILPVIFTIVFMFGFIARLLFVAQRRKPTTGDVGMIGTFGTTRSEIDGTGKVFVHGELWNVRSTEKIAEGQSVRVTNVDGLVLEVERLPETRQKGE